MKTIIITLLLTCLVVQLKAQLAVNMANSRASLDVQVFACGGGFVQMDQGESFQYCIGEAIIQTFTNKEIAFTQGFEQPHLMNNRYSELGLNTGFQWTLYPNPTTYLAKVKFVLKQPAKVRVEVIDQLGAKLSSFSKFYELGEVEIPINVRHLAVGGYYVQVYINNEKYERPLVIQ